MDIAAWLGELGLERYVATFRENAIDAEVLPDPTDADLQKLGVPLGHRKRLLKATAALRAGASAPASSQLSRLHHKQEERQRQNAGGWPKTCSHRSALFTERFDTADLKDAKALLDELR